MTKLIVFVLTFTSSVVNARGLADLTTGFSQFVRQSSIPVSPEEVRRKNMVHLQDMSWMFNNLSVKPYSSTDKFNAQLEVVGKSVAIAAVGLYAASYLPANIYLASAAAGLSALVYGKKGFGDIAQKEQASNDLVSDFEHRKFIWTKGFQEPLENGKVFSDVQIKAFKNYGAQDDQFMSKLIRDGNFKRNIFVAQPHEGANPAIVNIAQQGVRINIPGWNVR